METRLSAFLSKEAFRERAADKDRRVLNQTARDYEARTGKESARTAERLGIATSSVMPALLGASLGTAATLGNPIGGVVGAGVGAVSPWLVAGVAAAMTKTRTTKEQDEAESTRAAVQDLVVPGVAAYNSWKRLGHGYAKQKGTVK